MMRKQLITTSQAAQILSCSPDNVRRLTRSGGLPVAATVGQGQRLFEKGEVERIAVEREQRQSAAAE
ncbi:MAG TPA: helix-turn-helix domain-containing protein [Kofleriaceae bacterium]|jgi:excisionase family DNA binding protein